MGGVLRNTIEVGRKANEKESSTIPFLKCFEVLTVLQNRAFNYNRHNINASQTLSYKKSEN